MVRRGADHQIDIRGAATGLRQCLVAGVHGHFGHDAGLIIAALAQQRVHYIRVQNAGLVHHIAVLDARGLEDELFRRVLHRLHRASCYRVGIRSVLLVCIGVEGGDKLGIGDDAIGRENTGAGDCRGIHGGSWTFRVCLKCSHNRV